MWLLRGCLSCREGEGLEMEPVVEVPESIDL